MPTGFEWFVGIVGVVLIAVAIAILVLTLQGKQEALVEVLAASPCGKGTYKDYPTNMNWWHNNHCCTHSVSESDAMDIGSCIPY